MNWIMIHFGCCGPFCTFDISGREGGEDKINNWCKNKRHITRNHQPRLLISEWNLSSQRLTKRDKRHWMESTEPFCHGIDSSKDRQSSNYLHQLHIAIFGFYIWSQSIDIAGSIRYDFVSFRFVLFCTIEQGFFQSWYSVAP